MDQVTASGIRKTAVRVLAERAIGLRLGFAQAKGLRLPLLPVFRHTRLDAQATAALSAIDRTLPGGVAAAWLR